MLTRIDRLQLAVPDRRAAAGGWVALLGAEPDGEDRIAHLGAARSRYRLGRGFVELLEPDGPGVVADAVAKRGGHLFAAGAAAADLAGLAARLRERGVEVAEEAGQAYPELTLAGDVGLRLVLSPDEPQPRVGAVDFLYEATLLVDDAPAVCRVLADLLGLEPGAFVPIESENYGYAGTLTLFDPDSLHRLEVITPTAPGKTMGRFFARFGQTYYMAFAETDALADIEERARDLGAGYTADPPAGRGPLGTIFLHPPALGGTMLGLSRPTLAWQWSGHPERVEAAS